MLAVSGIVARKGRVLVCRRSSEMFFGGSWEFPTFEIEDGETAEDSLERNFFECLSVQVAGARFIGARSMVRNPNVRFFSYGVEISQKVRWVNGYSSFKWLKINELRRIRLSPGCVTSIKTLENF